MKRALHLMIALLFAFVGMANAQLVIDFETGDLSQLNQFNPVNDDNYPWQVVVKGSDHYCMQSGNAGVESSISAISISVNYNESGYITFDANCMGEGATYDVCEFLIDGNSQFSNGEDVQEWHNYGFNVTAGMHRFTWRYSKDGSVNPDGDCFQVDNITIGLGDICIPPTWIKTGSATDYFYVEWNGTASSYALRYKKGSDPWTTVNGITEKSYSVYDVAVGLYTVEVQAECDPETWVSTKSLVYEPTYWNDWYGFANYTYNDANYRRFIHFKFENLSEVTAVSDSYDDGGDGIYSATFVNGYVWYIRFDYISEQYNLYRAPVDMWNKTIGTAELLKTGFEWAGNMSYNVIDGRIYFIDDYGYLKKFNPNNVNNIETCGEIGYPNAFAINRRGQAYASLYDNESNSYALYTIDLSNASKTKVGVVDYYVSAMAFDMLTDELFGVNGSVLLYIQPETAYMCYIGGLDSSTEISGLFMTYPYNAVEEVEVEDVNVYPNPAQGYFTVEGTGKLTITNLLGQEVLVREIEGKTVVELNQGMYLVRLNNAVSKVVVE